MYQVYRGNKSIGVFRTPNEIRDMLHLDCESTFRLVLGEKIDGLRVSRPVAGVKRRCDLPSKVEIAKMTGSTPEAIEKTISRALDKLRSAGVLHRVLEMIRALREIEERQHGDYEIEMTTRITIEEDI